MEALPFHGIDTAPAPAAFNLNDYILVKFTDAGYEVLVDYHQAPGFAPHWPTRTIEQYRANVDENGYTQMQAWEFMQVFGPLVRVGGPDLFDMNVLLMPSRA